MLNKEQLEELMWEYCKETGSDDITSLHVCDNFREWMIDKLLKKIYFKFPTTGKEVKEFEKQNDIESVELPESLKCPMKILKEKEIHLKLSNIKIDKDNLDYIKTTGEICGKLRYDLVTLFMSS